MTHVRIGLLIALVIVWAWVAFAHGGDPDFASRLTFVATPISIAIIATIVVDMYRRRKP